MVSQLQDQETSLENYLIRKDTQRMRVFLVVGPQRGVRGGGGPPEPINKNTFFHQRKEMYETNINHYGLGGGGGYPELSGLTTKHHLFFCVSDF